MKINSVDVCGCECEVQIESRIDESDVDYLTNQFFTSGDQKRQLTSLKMGLSKKPCQTGRSVGGTWVWFIQVEVDLSDGQ